MRVSQSDGDERLHTQAQMVAGAVTPGLGKKALESLCITQPGLVVNHRHIIPFDLVKRLFIRFYYLEQLE